MRKRNLSRSVVAVLLSAVTVFCTLSPAAHAATTSEIKEEITDLKVENAVIQKLLQFLVVAILLILFQMVKNQLKHYQKTKIT